VAGHDSYLPGMLGSTALSRNSGNKQQNFSVLHKTETFWDMASESPYPPWHNIAYGSIKANGKNWLAIENVLVADPLSLTHT
jgi:hypothetical protein